MSGARNGDVNDYSRFATIGNDLDASDRADAMANFPQGLCSPDDPPFVPMPTKELPDELRKIVCEKFGVDGSDVQISDYHTRTRMVPRKERRAGAACPPVPKPLEGMVHYEATAGSTQELDDILHGKDVQCELRRTRLTVGGADAAGAGAGAGGVGAAKRSTAPPLSGSGWKKGFMDGSAGVFRDHRMIWGGLLPSRF